MLVSDIRNLFFAEIAQAAEMVALEKGYVTFWPTSTSLCNSRTPT